MALPLYWWWYGTPSDKPNVVLSSFRFNISNKQKIKTEEKVVVDSHSKPIGASSISFSSIRPITQSYNIIFDNPQCLDYHRPINISNLSGVIFAQRINIDSQGIPLYEVLKNNPIVFDFLSYVEKNNPINFAHRSHLACTNPHNYGHLQILGQHFKLPLTNNLGVSKGNLFSLSNTQDIKSNTNFNFGQLCIIQKEDVISLENLQKIGRDDTLSLSPFSSVLKGQVFDIDSRGALYLSNKLNISWGGRLILYDIESNQEFVFDWWLRPEEGDWWWTIPSRDTVWVLPIRGRR
jgi:hypothetical protein